MPALPCLPQVPRQRRNMEALQLISDTLDVLIAKCKKLVRWGGAPIAAWPLPAGLAT